jgi:hypothetical protein
MDGINIDVEYGYRILRPSSCVNVVPSKPDPLLVVILAYLWFVAKVVLVVAGTVCLTTVLSLSFPHFAFPLGMMSGFLGFVAWNLLP